MKTLKEEWTSLLGVGCGIVIFALLILFSLIACEDDETKPNELSLIYNKLDSINLNFNQRLISLNTFIGSSLRTDSVLLQKEIALTNYDTSQQNWASDKDIANALRVFTYDGCEYIRFSRGNSSGRTEKGYMAHKGNCTNPIHRNHVDKKLDKMYNEAKSKINLIESIR